MASGWFRFFRVARLVARSLAFFSVVLVPLRPASAVCRTEGAVATAGRFGDFVLVCNFRSSSSPQHRDYAFRSAPISPRRTPSSNSAGSASLSSGGDPFCTTYRDNVVAAADGEMRGTLKLPPLMDDASAAMESQVTTLCLWWLAWI